MINKELINIIGNILKHRKKTEAMQQKSEVFNRYNIIYTVKNDFFKVLLIVHLLTIFNFAMQLSTNSH